MESDEARRESGRLSGWQAGPQSSEPGFDVNKCIRLILPFSERDIERIANALKWPKDVWTILLQCVFTGKAQEAYASLSPDDSLNYETVKGAVLRAYELVPEAYRQKFRNYKKAEGQSYVEFGREKIALFDRWCASQDVKTFDQLRDLIIMEEFKRCIPDKVATYLNEQKATSVTAAATLADEYVLTHRESFEKPRLFPQHTPAFRPAVEQAVHGDAPNKNRSVMFCSYCKKRGHQVNNCFLLSKKKPKPVALVDAKHAPLTQSTDLDVFSPFLMKGFVSLPDGNIKVPVNIIRDTAASRSIILQRVLPLSENIL